MISGNDLMNVISILSILVSNFVIFLKSLIEFLNNYSTLILVIITGIYAYFTYKMQKVMEKQVIADIRISNKTLASDLLEIKSQEITKKSYFQFNLFFTVRNGNSGSGSIDKPILILKFKNDGFKYEVTPTTKSIKYHTSHRGSWEIEEEDITDLGGTIFLRGGDSQKVELEYSLYDFDDNLLKHLTENIDGLEYSIKFSDNLGKEHRLLIPTIRKRRR